MGIIGVFCNCVDVCVSFIFSLPSCRSYTESEVLKHRILLSESYAWVFKIAIQSREIVLNLKKFGTLGNFCATALFVFPYFISFVISIRFLAQEYTLYLNLNLYCLN